MAGQKALLEQVLSLCGGGRTLNLGIQDGDFVIDLLSRGVDAYGADESTTAVELASARAPGRFEPVTLPALPYADESFDTVVCTGVFAAIEEAAVAPLMAELARVTRRFLVVQLADASDPFRPPAQVRQNRAWWEGRLFDAGFRKHPDYLSVLAYDALEHEREALLLLAEKVPANAAQQYSIAWLAQERDLHMDMLRESGRRSDAHVLRYHLAAQFVRAEDVVLDVACGMGYGSGVLLTCSGARRVLGADNSERAVAYAQANYGGERVQFHLADAARLSFLPDASVDCVTCFETLEHVADPAALLGELQRVLTPGGRLIISVPNQWLDETGRDPNPHHLQVYDWTRLRSELSERFLLEKAYGQWAGGALKHSHAARELREVSIQSSTAPADPEWWLFLALKDPVGAGKDGFAGRYHPTFDAARSHITAFERDYEDPWLVRAMVTIGMRHHDPAGLTELTRRVLAKAQPGSADAGAALCVQAYQLLSDPQARADAIEKMVEELLQYSACADDTPHAHRWRISNVYAAGRLTLRLGRRAAARKLLQSVAPLDCLRFSPLLATKTVDACYMAGWIAACDGDLAGARADWEAGLTETQRVLQGDWTALWGDIANPPAFALPEAAGVLRAGARCAAGLYELSHGWLDRPGRRWTRLKDGGLGGVDAAKLLEMRQELSRENMRMRRRLDSTNDERSVLRGWTSRLAEELERRARESGELFTRLNKLSQVLERVSRELGASRAAYEAAQQRLHDEIERRHALSADLSDAQVREKSALARIDQLDGLTETLRSELAAKTDEAHRLWAALQKSESERQATAKWSGELDQRVVELDQRLQGIYQSTGWAVLQKMYRVRFFLFPRGSFQENLARRFMQWRRRTSQAARGSQLAVRQASATPIADGARDLPGGFGGMQPGLVSVILPVYNQGYLLGDAIESVLAQTYKNFELIIVNDGSSDDALEVALRYRSDPRVRILSQRNQRLPKALSNGFTFARGEFWCWTSADNLMGPHQLERTVAFLRENERAAMVFCDYLAIDDRGQPLRDPNFRPHNRSAPDSPEIHLPRDVSALNTVQDNFVGPCFLYRGWTGRLLGEYAPNLGVEDYDYWMRLNSLLTLRHIGDDEILYQYRVHDNTLSARASEHRILQRVQRLMQYDEGRRAWYAAPWTVYADAPLYRALAGGAVQADVLNPLDALEIAPDEPVAVDGAAPGAKRLVFVEAENLPAVECRAGTPCSPGTLAVGVFSGDAEQAYDARTSIEMLRPLCLTQNPALAARLALFTPDVLTIPSLQAALPAARAFGNARCFYETTTPIDDRARVLPDARSRGAGPLRVLIQTDHLEQGGLEQVVLDAAAVLMEQGADVRLLVLGRQGPAAEQARRRGIEVVELPRDQREAAYERLLEGGRFDVVNAHYSLFGAEQAARLGVPFVQVIHNTYVWYAPPQIDALRAADPFTTAYLCVSANVARYSDVCLGLPVEKLIIAPNGIDLERMAAARAATNRSAIRRELGIGERDFVFLNTASVLPAKAQAMLIAAAGKAAQRVPGLRVALLGRTMDPAYERTLEQAIANAGAGDLVVRLGYHESADRFYYAFDGFALPSFWEGWSLALGEALAAGLPIVASDVGAARELVAAAGGRLVATPFRSITQLRGDTLGQWLTKPQPEYVDQLADALAEVAGHRQPPALSPALLRRLDHRTAYGVYLRIFEWLRGGGTPSAARAWVWEAQGWHAWQAREHRSADASPRLTAAV